MKYLLDIHTFLWMINDDPALSKLAREILRDTNNDLFLSIASAWEVGIKIGSGKLVAPKEPLDQFFRTQLNRTAIDLLDVNLTHIELITRLPRHHRDPFDRMLIAQSIAEGLPIISADSAFDPYGVTRLW